MISQSPPTQFSLTFSNSTGVVSTSESTRHLWKVFRWWFLSRQRTSFRWLFLSHQELLVLINPRVSWESVSLMISETVVAQFSLTVSKSTGVASTSESRHYLWKVFRWWFLTLQRLSFRWLFVSQQGCGRWRIHASSSESVSLMISETVMA
jgi:hypothetical protein